jgi:hypothetical protein
METVGKLVLGSVSETVFGFAVDHAGLEQIGEVTVKGDLPQADDDTDALQGLDLGGEMRGAVAEFLRRGFVARRSAANDRGDPGVAQFETVIAGDRAPLAGEAEVVEDGIHEVAGAVSGEGTAGAVGSVSAGSEAEDEDTRAGVAEAGNGPSPVGLVLIGATFGLRDTSAVDTETGAALAVDDGLLNLLKVVGRTLCAGWFHCIP